MAGAGAACKGRVVEPRNGTGHGRPGAASASGPAFPTPSGQVNDFGLCLRGHFDVVSGVPALAITLPGVPNGRSDRRC